MSAYSGQAADGERLSSCPPDASLLDAMVKLFETRAAALVLETVDGLPVRHVTLGSIISTLQKGRVRDNEPESAAGPGRASAGP